MEEDELVEKMQEAESRGLKRMEKIMQEKMNKLEQDLLSKQEKKKDVQQKADQLARKFKAYVYKLIIPALFNKGIENEARAIRQGLAKEYEETFPLMVDYCYKSMVDLMKNKAKLLWAETDSIHCIEAPNIVMPYSGEKVASRSDMDSRCEKIYQCCNSIIQGLEEECKEEVYSPFLLKFLGKYVSESNHLYRDFHFEFETKRLEFNSFGGLK